MKQFFKKIALASALFITTNSLFAQTPVFSENFNAGTTLPAGWSQQSYDLFTVATNLSTYNFGTNGWIVFSPAWAQATGDNCALSTSWYTTVSTSDDWLKSPAITLTSGNFLTWKEMTPDQNYPDGYVLKLSTLPNPSQQSDYSVTLTTVTGANGSWTEKFVDLSAYAGQTIHLAWVNNSTDKFLLGIDDISIFTPPVADITVNSVSPANLSPASFGTVGQSKTIVVNITNNSGTTLTSVNGTYAETGGTPVNQIFNTNIAPFASTNLSFTTPYSIAAVGDHPIDVYMTVTGDVDTTDNFGSTVIGGAAFIPDHTVVIEEATGTWCGWCVRGIVYLEEMHDAQPNDPVLIAVHNSDPMANTTYDTGLGDFIGGYPSIVADRKQEYDPSEIFDAYTAHKPDFAFANITATQTYNAATRASQVDVVVSSAVDLVGDYRLACVYTENALFGTGSSWEQHNYYSSASQDIPLVGAGYDWQAQPEYVPGLFYNFVARQIIGGFNGQSGSLPGTIGAFSTNNYTFNYTLPQSYVADNMNVIVLLINATSGQILNATSPKSITGISNAANNSVSQLTVYPNPAVNEVNALFYLTNNETATIEITDVLGRVITSNNYNNLAKGNQLETINIKNLTTGIYNLNIKTANGIATRKFTKN